MIYFRNSSRTHLVLETSDDEISNDEYELDAGNESEDDFDQRIDLMIGENLDIEIIDDFEDDSDSEVEELISERIPKKQKCSSFIDSNRKLTYTGFSERNNRIKREMEQKAILYLAGLSIELVQYANKEVCRT